MIGDWLNDLSPLPKKPVRLSGRNDANHLAGYTFGKGQTAGFSRQSARFSFRFPEARHLGALQLSLLPAIISIFFTDLFDSLSTFMGCSYAVGLKDKDGQPLNLRQGLIVDSWATLTAGLLGTSAGTAYAESAAGMEMGGRTGLTSIVTALCFLPCLFLAPLASVVPSYATAPVLILVGALMFRSVTQLKLGKLEELIPAFLTIVLIPLTFSITQGILWGLTSYVLLHLLMGKRKEVQPTLYALSGLSAALLLIESFHLTK